MWLFGSLQTIFGLCLVSFVASDFLDAASGDELAMWGKLDVDQYLPNRIKRDTEETKKAEAKPKKLTPAWIKQGYPDTYGEAIQDEIENSEKEVSLDSNSVDVYSDENGKAQLYDNATYKFAPNDPASPSSRSSKPEKKINEGKVARYPYKEGINQKEPAGCGRPVCAIIDARPVRFSSLCQLFSYMKERGLVRRILHIQKGDCADAIDDNGKDWPWSNNPSGNCNECLGDKEVCGQEICVASNKDSLARTFKSVCNFLEKYHDAKDIRTLHVGLGKCSGLFGEGKLLFTEWFDVDEPCLYGDTEDVIQNLAWTFNFQRTAPWRLCSKAFRKGTGEIETTQGHDIPTDQIVTTDNNKDGVVCKNEKQIKKPPPPDYWFHRKIRCVDYKIRHQCECMYGCLNPPEDAEEGTFKVILPKVETLFDECYWQPFVDTTTPNKNTWDAEVRGTIIKKNPKLMKHVCNDNLIDAMYIDTRRVEDDKPVQETGELITKNTPNFGFLCVNKNNEPKNKLCSDYKTRFCCKKQPSSTWGAWEAWSTCTKSCGGGNQTTTRKCQLRGNEPCFGSHKDMVNGKDRYKDYKMKTQACNIEGCPGDAKFQPWGEWEACEATCVSYSDKQRDRLPEQKRIRTCSPAVNNGKPCPNKRNNLKKYEEWRKCPDLPLCPEPEWTTWSSTKCSATCGAGTIIRTRKCEDLNTGKELDKFFDCNAKDESDFKQTRKCNNKDKPCAVKGGFTEWQNWSACSVDCGKGGMQVRKRYCANPMPIGVGSNCTGDFEETRNQCLDITTGKPPPPCPINCQISNWGIWNRCSITCGEKGEGSQHRYRRIIQEAKYGGKPCRKNIPMEEVRTCRHKKMTKRELEGVAEEDTIYNCPVDCKIGEWKPWDKSNCAECCGGNPPIRNCDFERKKPVTRSRYYESAQHGGKECDWDSLYETSTCGKIAPMRDCGNKKTNHAYWAEWSDWGECAGTCHQKIGFKTRSRFCIEGDVDGKEYCPTDRLNENIKCYGKGSDARCIETDKNFCREANFCPSPRWGKWEAWTDCTVTCGKAPRTRTRKCQDIRSELENSPVLTCKGEENEQSVCDMGPCPGDNGYYEEQPYAKDEEVTSSKSDTPPSKYGRKPIFSGKGRRRGGKERKRLPIRGARGGGPHKSRVLTK
jgi:hypothetical protein